MLASSEMKSLARLAFLTRLIHYETVLGADRMPVPYLIDMRTFAAPGEDIMQPVRIGYVRGVKNAGVPECEPDQGLMRIDGLGRSVGAAFETQRDRPGVVQILEHRPIQLLFDPEEDSDRKAPGEVTVSESVAHGGKRLAVGRRRMQIEHIHLVPGGYHDRVE